MNVGFAGTPEFARVALKHLLNAGYPVKLVLTQPDRPAGRGMKLTASPVKQLAQEHGIPVLQPLSLKKGDEAEQALQALKMSADGQPLDVLIVAAYGLILPQAVLDAPRLGCLNIHGSLLPRWRGAAPIHRAIEAGDAQTGVCIMQMEAGLDTGPVGLCEALPILPSDTTATLHDKLADLGGRLMVQALQQLAQGELHFEVQPEQGVTYADKISKAEGEIDWTQPAAVLQRRLRAFDPFPGASTQFGGELLKCFDPVVAHSARGQASAGTVLAVDAQGMVVQCGEGALCVATLQKAGSRRAPAQQVAQAMGLQAGNCLAA
ncbi:methionyl-tRNA formyltransferase [Limnobacter humi]|uniref:Methionyl-tRNA formyltransferase n=1 Tax=Limnobacter humi TaxID=1778671 RepID=A0ABT1WDJ0_9BURK|nr:methionyl-tRNA formyltransferase [Limnobacter humi]MCQ8895587.1 methionyl-tRNA formyltransferase [Limnobacter humi]